MKNNNHFDNKIIKSLPFLLAISLLLSSCFRPKLREDISKFITPFSYEKAIKEYKAASYTKTQIIQNKDVTFKVDETFDFDRKDELNMSYKFSYNEYKNDQITLSKTEEIKAIDDKYFYYLNDEEIEEFTITRVNFKIDRFFYDNVNESVVANYHGGGMYFGDQLLETAYKMQNHIDIDEENETLIVQFINFKNSDGLIENQLYHVDKFGMLIDYDLEKEKDDYYRKDSIVIIKK